MDTSPAVRDRINTAADALYEESGRRTIPTVDAVRKLARVNINDASNCMREWRRVRSAQSDVPQLQIPDKLQLACTTALHALWREAVNLSGETLRMAQAGWDAERADAQSLSEQIESACAALEDELLTATTELDCQKEAMAKLNEELAASRSRANDAERSAAELRTAASNIEARSLETVRRADDLRQALEQAHATYILSASEHSNLQRAQRDEIAGLRDELEASRQMSEARIMAAREEVRVAVEDASRLRGSLEAVSNGNGSAPVQRTHSTKQIKHK